MLKKLIKLLSFLSLFLANESFQASTNIVHTVFAPGVSSSRSRVQVYAKGGAFAGKQYSGIIFPDQKKPKNILDKIIYRLAKRKGRTVNRGKIVLANGHDIKAVKDVVDQAKNKDPKSNGILFGTCRGASAIIQYLAHNDSKWVKGIVLDSPFADPNVLLKDRVNRVFVKMLLPKFNTKATTLLDGIKNIKNKNIKVLILFAKGTQQAKGDSVTPFHKHIKPLYNEFKENGFDVTICSYNAEHCGGIDTEKKNGDQKAYTETIQKWYKKQNFIN